MKVVVLYRPNSEYGTMTESFVRDFKYQHEDRTIEVMDIDSREGMAMTSLYDIMQHPAILVTRDDGSVLKYWEGSSLPLMEEVAGYLNG